MAVAFVRSHVGEFVKSAGTTDVYALTSLVPAGNLLVMALVHDNFSSASTPTVSSITKAAGETASWVYLGRAVYGSAGTAGAFSGGELWAIKTTVAWANATSLTVTYSNSITMKAQNLFEFSGAEATLRSTVGMNYAAGTSVATATTTGTTPVIGDLAVGLLFQSNSTSSPANDTDTTGGSWVIPASATVGSTGSSAATNNTGMLSYKILTTASHQTHNSSAASLAAGNGSVVAILRATPDPAITQAAYRWYDEGTESGSTPYAAQDTAVTGNIANGDATGTLRIRLQETGSGAVPATDDWQLQYDKNASGSWTNVTASSTGASTYDSPNLTNGGATTQRLTGGTGTFVAGKVSEDSLMDDLGWATSNFTELVYALTIKAADVVGGDTLRFRVLRNGATTTMTYTVTPTINIVNIPAAITQAAYGFFAEGTESGATSLAATNTAITADVATADLPLQVRVRLQSTNSTTVPTTDDWQLQWELNASGTWTNVASGGGGAPALYDAYDDGAAANFSVVGRTNIALGQTFLGDGKALSRAGFHLTRIGTVSGPVTATLYSHTGTYGSTGTAVDGALAVSTSSVDASTMTVDPTFTWYEFDFDGTYVLEAGTPYAIAVTADFGGTDNLNAVRCHRNAVTTGHPGNATTRPRSGAWSAGAYDFEFRVYTSGGSGGSTVAPYDSASLTDNATISVLRAGAGTGSPVAGKVSEDGLVSDFGWAGSNYTEHLYSVILKKDDLANGDVIRLRVLRNGAVLDSYAQTPTLTASKVAGPVTHLATGSLAVTTTVAAATTRTTLPTTTALAATTATAAAATRTTLSATTALAITTNRTAAATRTTLTPATALAVTTSRTAAASRTTLPTTTALAVTTSRTAAATRTTFSATTALTVTTTATADASATPGVFEDPGDLTGLAGWWDASDAATVLHSSGQLVREWQDKSGAGRHLTQVDIGSQPVDNGTQNGRKTLVFNQTHLVAATAADWKFMHDGTNHTVFIMLKINGGNTYAGLMGTTGSAALGPGFDVLGVVANRDIRHAVSSTSDANVVLNTLPSSSITLGTWFLFGLVSQPNGPPSGRSSIRLNGGTAFTGNSVAGTVSASNPPSPLTIGSRSPNDTGLTWLIGEVGEVAIYSRSLNATERANVEGYFAAKWIPAGIEYTVTTLPLAVTTTVAAAATRTTLAPATALAVTTSRTAAATRTTFAAPTSALAVTTTATAAATRTGISATAALAVTTNRTAAATRTTFSATTALPLTATLSAAATRATAMTTTALAVTTSRSATATRTGFATPTALAITTTATAATSRTTTVPVTALAVTTSRTAAATRTGLAAPTALAVTTTATAATSRATTVSATALAVTTSLAASATRTGFATTTALAVTTSRTATVTKVTTALTTALPVTTTATAAAITGAGVVAALPVTSTLTSTVVATRTTAGTALAITTSRTATVTKTTFAAPSALAVTSTLIAATSRATFATTTALAVTTVVSAAALRAAAPAGAALAVTTSRTATAVRTAAPATAGLAVTVTLTATAVRTAAPATAALAVTTSSTATAVRTGFVSGTALAITTSRTASATRTTLSATTALPVTTFLTASVVKTTSVGTTALVVTTSMFASPTPGGAVSAVALAATATLTAAATRTTFATTALAVTTSRSAAAARATFTTSTALAVTTTRTASASRTTFTTSTALVVTTTRTAASSRVTSVTTTALVVTTTISAASTPGAAVSSVALTITTTRTAAAGRTTYTTTSALSITTSRTAGAARLTLVPTVALSVTTTRTATLGAVRTTHTAKVVISGGKKNIVWRWVIVGGQKKVIANRWVIVGGQKKSAVSGTL